MHVGLNLIFLVPGETGGMEVYVRELLPELVAAAPDVRFTAFVGREAAAERGAPWSELMPSVTVPVKASQRVQWVLGEQVHLPRGARAAGADLVHSFASTAPASGRFRRVVTVHDLIYRIYPDAHSGVRNLGMRVLVPLAVRRSDRVIADSESTRDDLVRYLGTPRERVDVVPLGPGGASAAAPLDAAEVRRRHELGDRPLVLSVSAKRPHKNLIRLLDAIAAIPPERRPVLVIPGYPTWHEAELRARAAELSIAGDVRFPGWVDEPELEGLYAAAAGFVFPSLYEGFGLPVLEAMRRGVPVACSDRSSLPEVAGDAALLFDPDDSTAIAQAVERLVTDGELARRLRAGGMERAARFTWRATALGTLESYRRALGGAATPTASAGTAAAPRSE